MVLEDIPAGLRLCRLSGWNQVEDDWLPFLASYQGGGWVAEERGAVVGTVTFLQYGSFSWVAMMLVDPGRRRGGVGTQLMEAVLESLRGEACVRLDASPEGEPLYRRLGFVPECELERAGMVAGTAHGPVRSRALIRAADTVDLPDILAWDREIFGADRGPLLGSFFRRAPELAWTARMDGRIAGYTFGRPGRLSSQVGPITAVDVEVAGDLMRACLAGQAGCRVAVDVPPDAWTWIEWLRGMGFRTERPFLRMRLGSPAPGIPERRFAIAGPEFG